MKHREQELKRNALYNKQHPESHLESESRRRARKKGTMTEKLDFVYVKARDKNTCGICDKQVPEGDIHFDHIIPLSRGGTHTYDNIQVAHSNCNLRKWANVGG